MSGANLQALECEFCGSGHFLPTNNRLMLECQYCGRNFLLKEEVNLPEELFSLKFSDARKNKLLRDLRVFIEHEDFARADKKLDDLIYDYPEDSNVKTAEHALLEAKELSHIRFEMDTEIKRLEANGYKNWVNFENAEYAFSLYKRAKTTGKIDLTQYETVLRKTYLEMRFGKDTHLETWNAWSSYEESDSIVSSYMRLIQYNVKLKMKEESYRMKIEPQRIAREKELSSNEEQFSIEKYGKNKIERVIVVCILVFSSYIALWLFYWTLFASIFPANHMTINYILATLVSGCSIYQYFEVKKYLHSRKKRKIKEKYKQIISEIANEYENDIHQLKSVIETLEALIMKEDGFDLKKHNVAIDESTMDMDINNHN